MTSRRISKEISIGRVRIGGGNPIAVQSMTNTDTRDVKATIGQIRDLKEAGCEIIRVAVPDQEAAGALRGIKEEIDIPLVADVHFDYKLALMAAERGVDKLRINPGNIGNKERVKKVVEICSEKGIPIRIGVNSGSIEKKVYQKYGGVCSEALVESALNEIRTLENSGFYDIVISIKSSDVPMTISAYRMLAEVCDYPLHVGVTEAGTEFSGAIKSAIGIGSLLADGIGDTIRVSLTADPVREVEVGWEILKALNLRKRGVEIISCPTCGRRRMDVISMAREVEERTKNFARPLKIAVMGCEVNGPGEAKVADLGIAGGGKGIGLIFKNGSVYKKVKQENLVVELLKEIDKLEVSGRK